MPSQALNSPNRFASYLIFTAYALHSFASLAHEVIWIKLLTTTFGVSLVAVALVMAVFVSGLAMGSLAIALAERYWNGRAILCFGVLQAGLGIWAICLPHLVHWLDDACLTAAPASGSLGHLVSRLGMVAVAILIPSSLIGAVFPLLSGFSPQLSREQAQGPGRLYLIGLASSAAGAAVAPIWLLPRFGVTASASFVGLINLALAVFAIGFGRWLMPTALSAPQPNPESESGVIRPHDLGWVGLVQGFALFGLEVIGAKVIWLSVDTTAYAEATLFAVVLIAMAAGCAVALLLRSWRVPVLPMLGYALLFAALTQSLMIPLAGQLAFGFSNAVRNTTWVTSSVPGFCFAEAMLVVMQLGLPVMFGAIAFTNLCEMAVRGQNGFSNPIGRLYAWNNVGAVAGSLVTALVLVPLLGLTWSLTALSLLLVIAGVVLLWRREQSMVARVLAVGSALLISVLVVTWGASRDITFRDFAAGPQHVVVFHHEDGLGLVEVLENRIDHSRILRSSRLRQEGGTQPQHVRMQRMQGRLPIMLHQAPQKLLVVGLGTGISLNALIWEGTTSVSCVELSQGVIAAEQFFRPFNGDIRGNPKVKLIREDGREFVKLTRERYDLIVQDVFFPYQAGISNLYSVEHFQRCRQKLAPGGCVAQWICINQVGTEDLKTLVHSFTSVFPHTTAWLDEIYLLLYGTLDPITIDLRTVAERIETRGAAGEISTPADLFERFICDEQTVARWTDGLESNTEDNARIEFQTPLKMSELNSDTLAARNLRELQFLKQPAAVICRATDRAEVELLARADQASRLNLSGRIALAENNPDAVRRDFTALFRLNPSNHVARDWLVDDALAREEEKFWSGDRTAALEILEEGRAVAPEHPRILIARAGLLALQEKWQEAADTCFLLLEHDPRNTRARTLLGNMQFEMGQLAEAETTFRRGLEDAPDDRMLLRWLQRCLAERARSPAPKAIP